MLHHAHFEKKADSGHSLRFGRMSALRNNVKIRRDCTDVCLRESLPKNARSGR